ncbi:predicted protein [Plenodomus lingam JN3]|uniref:Uncharacterized protein n=1 Tax=Leptosphaeria maculans (strain JN3 / isolate v23.1.3 / race Av1-4-5-6-7-8) TaxID=985895 RepID=E5A737_LEPMJ|nr:predicted protein [Plenodomus lingam JN3]CBX99432.1 predicted protein [Plenodomus lingam JN3]
MLTLGLLRQIISVRLFEQSSGFREVGAGIAFSACARQCSAYSAFLIPIIVQTTHHILLLLPQTCPFLRFFTSLERFRVADMNKS